MTIICRRLRLLEHQLLPFLVLLRVPVLNWDFIDVDDAVSNIQELVGPWLVVGILLGMNLNPMDDRVEPRFVPNIALGEL